MFLIHHHQLEDPARLTEAWEGDPTFALLPSGGDVAADWVEGVLQALPAELTRGHFALLTSGSTGKPKLLVGSRERAEALAELIHQAQDGEAARETVGLLPLSYSYALVNQFVWARVTGRPLRATPGLGRADVVRRALTDAQDAMVCLTGAQLPLLGRNVGEGPFPGVIRVQFAGGPFPERSLEQVWRLFPNAQVTNNFGCTEAMPRLTVRPVGRDEHDIGIGLPLPGVELRCDPDGSLQFRSPYSAVAELDDEGLRPLGEWCPTGDLASFDEAAGEWRVQGRVGEVFKRFGIKVSIPALLKSVHERWQGEAAVYRETDGLGEPGHVLVLSPPPSSDQVRDVLRVLRQSSARAAWPSRIESVAQLRLLPNGKADVAALPQLPDKTVHWRQRLA